MIFRSTRLRRFSIDSVDQLRGLVNATGPFGQPGTKCLISPQSFSIIVIKLPAEQMCMVQSAFAVQATHRDSPRDCDSLVLFLHEL